MSKNKTETEATITSITPPPKGANHELITKLKRACADFVETSQKVTEATAVRLLPSVIRVVEALTEVQRDTLWVLTRRPESKNEN
jgi:hypothetical protein